MGIIGNIKREIDNFSMFRRGVMPPNERFNAHFSREIGKIMERYYPAADLSANRADWSPSVLVDQNIYRLEYRRLFARAKRAYDTDPYARSCVRVLQTQVIGTGIQPRSKAQDKNGNSLVDLEKLLDKLWEWFADECLRPNHDNFYEIQAKYIANLSVSGGMFLNEVPAPKGNLLPFAFQIIDQSYIEFSHDNYAMPSAPMIYNGVKINDFGEPLEYFFQDLVTWMFFSLPATNMIHCYDKWHATQWIGIPWLAPVLTTLWDLAQLQEDKLIASRIQAAIALWIPETNKAFSKKDANSDGNFSLSPGAIWKGGQEPKVIQSADHIKDSLVALIDLYLRQVARGFGVSFQEMTTDLAGANFSSARVITQDQRRYYKKKQQFVIRSLCQPVYNKFVQWCFLTGQIPGKSILDFKENQHNLCRARHTPDRWDWVDPLKDMQGYIEQRDAGWLTDEMYCDMVGENKNDLYATLAEEKKAKDALGISVVAPVAVTPNKFKTPDNAPGVDEEGNTDANK